MDAINIVREWQQGADRVSASESVTVTDRAVILLEPTLLANAASQEVLVALDVSQIKAIFISSNQVLSVDTDGVDQAAIAVAANAPLVWTTNNANACPFTADATKFVITTSVVGTAPTVKIRIVIDPTA